MDHITQMELQLGVIPLFLVAYKHYFSLKSLSILLRQFVSPGLAALLRRTTFLSDKQTSDDFESEDPSWAPFQVIAGPPSIPLHRTQKHLILYEL